MSEPMMPNGKLTRVEFLAIKLLANLCWDDSTGGEGRYRISGQSATAATHLQDQLREQGAFDRFDEEFGL